MKCKNTTLDVYANGTIVRSVNLIGVPKQNYKNKMSRFKTITACKQWEEFIEYFN